LSVSLHDLSITQATIEVKLDFFAQKPGQCFITSANSCFHCRYDLYLEHTASSNVQKGHAGSQRIGRVKKLSYLLKHAARKENHISCNSKSCNC